MDDAAEEKKVAMPKVPKPSKAAKQAPMESVGYYIGALTPMDDEPETVSPPKVKRPRARSSKEAPAQKVGYYIGAFTPLDDEVVEKKAKAPKARRPKAQPPEERSGYYIGAVTPMEDVPAKEGPAEKAKAPNYGFGWIEMKGKRYGFDVIVHVDGSVTKRQKGKSKQKKKKYGHTPLTRKELKGMGKEEPAMIIIGTGHSGSMPLTPKAKKFLEGYESFVGKTPKALDKLASCEKKAVALLHVTC